jgi:phage FluMu gp28-like protein
MPPLSVRKLCRSAGISRQWHSLHRRLTTHQEHDQQLRQAIQEMREAEAFYGYRRMTKALARAGRIGQSQAGLVCDAASWPHLSSKTTNRAYG